MIILRRSSPLLTIGVDLPNVVRTAVTCVSLTRIGYNAKCWLKTRFQRRVRRFNVVWRARYFVIWPYFYYAIFCNAGSHKNPNYLVTAQMTVQCINTHWLCEFSRLSTRCSWGHRLGNCVPSSGVFSPSVSRPRGGVIFNDRPLKMRPLHGLETDNDEAQFGRRAEGLTLGKGKAIPTQAWAGP